MMIGCVYIALLISGPFVVSSRAQDDDSNAASDLATNQQSEQIVDQATQNSSTTEPDEDFESASGPVTNLETGEPLDLLMTPFRVGRLSLLSATAYEGYNSNPEFQKIPVGTWLTAISGLVMYSAQPWGWKLYLQYQPFVWISPDRHFEDFAASALDLRKLHRINERWSWAAAERMRYAPTQSTAEGKGIVASPNGGFTIGNAFLSSGRNILVNAVSFTATDHYSENSSLIFHANQDYTRLSTYIGNDSQSFPEQQAIIYAAGATWRHHLNLKDTISLNYGFRAQTATAGENANFHTASIGWDHKLSPTLGFSLTVGPAWSVYTGNQDKSGLGAGRTTLHGSAAINKEFKRGGLILLVSRSDSFSGVLSDSFHNRYDITGHRALTDRIHVSASASYIQQQYSNQRDTNGVLVTSEGRYFLSRNWAVFSQARYLNITGSDRALAPEKSVIAGVRWSWVPEKP
jgi:hypothetical protein